MKVWVTGGSGSLGRSVLRALNETFPQIEVLSPSHSVLALDDQKAVDSFVAFHKPTHVIHLAAQVFGIAGHMAHPADSLLMNTKIDHTIFSALLSSPPEWVYYASTVAAYGFPYISMPLDEKNWLTGLPHDSEYGYAMAKRHAFSYLELLRRQHSTNFVYGLTTNLFGTGDRFLEGRGHVVISLLEKARRAKSMNEFLEVWGSGDASRDFLSTDDAAILILEMLGKHVGVVNVASGQEIRIAEIAEEIVKQFNLSKGYRFVGVNEGITKRVCSVDTLKLEAPSVAKIKSFEKLQVEIRNFLERA